MKHIKHPVLLALIFSSFDLLGQVNEKVEMADVLRRDGKIYTVVIGLVVILTAMIILLVRLDRKIFRLEHKKGKE